jgi:malate-CoA ligase subunit beta
MDIHEYQAKAILADYGLPIAQGGLAYSPEQAAYRTREIGGEMGSQSTSPLRRKRKGRWC